MNLVRAKDISNWGVEGGINEGEMIKSVIPLNRKRQVIVTHGTQEKLWKKIYGCIMLAF